MVTKKKTIIDFNSKKTSFFVNVYNTVAYIPILRNSDVENIEVKLSGMTGEVDSGKLKYKKDLKIKPAIKETFYENLKDKVEVEKFYVHKTKMLNETFGKAIKDLSVFGFSFDNEYYVSESPKTPIGILLRNSSDLMVCIIAPVVDDEDFANAVEGEK